MSDVLMNEGRPVTAGSDKAENVIYDNTTVSNAIKSLNDNVNEINANLSGFQLREVDGQAQYKLEGEGADAWRPFSDSTLLKLYERMERRVGTITYFPSDVGGTCISLKNTDIPSDSARLWTNPAPTSNMSAQKINIDMSNYDIIYVVTRFATGQASSQIDTGIIAKNIDYMFAGCIASTNPNYGSARRISFDDTGIDIMTTGKGIGSESTNGDNMAVIQYINGYKL